MSTDTTTSASGPLVGSPAHAESRSRTSAPAQSKAAVYARAEQQMRRGKRLVIGGFAVAVSGILGYCLASFGAALSPQLGTVFLDSPGWLVGPALGVIGLGTLVWLVGSYLYLIGGMDSDPDGPDIHF